MTSWLITSSHLIRMLFSVWRSVLSHPWESSWSMSNHIVISVVCFSLSLVTVTLWLIFPLMFSRRSFAKPPRAVQMVSECIVVMRGYKEVSWKQAKGMMSEANFLKSLTEMDVDGITTAQVLCVGLSVRSVCKWKLSLKEQIILRFPCNRVSFASIFWGGGDYRDDYTETKLDREVISN